MSRSALAGWDFTLFEEKNPDKKIVKEWCKIIAKKYNVQGEIGAQSGKKHWQGRISLKTRWRKTELLKHCEELEIFKNANWSPTNTKALYDDSYVTKDFTYCEEMGRFSDTDKELYIPRQFREIKKLYPWQQHIYDTWDNWDTRTINVIVDKIGNKGKSTIAGYMEIYQRGFAMPAINDIKDLMRIAYDVPTQRCYLIDFPRAMDKSRLFQFYSGIESLKNGKVYDDRYHYKQRWMDSPNIWIFTNKIPDISYMSKDRWKIWEITDDLKLALLKTSLEIDDLGAVL